MRVEDKNRYLALSDEDVLSLILSGDKNACSYLIEKYRPLIISRANAFKNGSVEIEDLIQEGTIGLYSAIKTYNASKGAAFSTFARLCVNRFIYACLRGASASKNIPVAVISTMESEVVDILANPEDIIIAEESFRLFFESAKSKLSDFEYKIFEMHISGCSYSEIQKSLSSNYKAVDNALSRIRNKIKNMPM